MYSQISVDNPLSLLYSVLTLNKETDMEKALDYLGTALMISASGLLVAFIVTLPWGAL